MPRNPRKKPCQTPILLTRFLNQHLSYTAGIVSVYLFAPGKPRVGQSKSAIINPAGPLQNPSDTRKHKERCHSPLFAKRSPEKIFLLEFN